MAQKTINVGTSANSGGGDPLRAAMIKINDNFTELYADVATLEAATGTDSGGTLVVNAIQGSVIGEDSTLIVDATTSTIDASRLTGTLPALDGSALTGISGGLADLVDDTTPQLGGNLDLNNFDITGTGDIPAANLTGTLPALDGSSLTGVTASSVAFADVTATPTTLAGYGIADAYTKTEVDNAITSSILPSGSTQSIDIVAADSTLLVDSVNGTLNATTLTGALPAIDGSALTGITTTFSNITSTPTTIAGYGITDAFDGAFGSLSGTPTTLSGYGITDAYTQTQVDTAITNATSSIVIPSGSTQSIDVVAADSTLLVDSVNGTLNSSALTKPIALADDEKITFGDGDDLEIYHNGTANYIAGAGGTILTGNWLYLRKSGSAENYLVCKADGAVEVYYDNVKTFATSAAGIQIEQGVEEKFDTLTSSTGTVTHDCDNGHVFYHTGATGDITANFTNLGLTAEYGTNLTVIINQGATPYEVTAVQIGGVAQTINWQGGSAPTGNANGIDSFSFTILNDGGTYVVLGQMVDFT